MSFPVASFEYLTDETEVGINEPTRSILIDTSTQLNRHFQDCLLK